MFPSAGAVFLTFPPCRIGSERVRLCGVKEENWNRSCSFTFSSDELGLSDSSATTDGNEVEGNILVPLNNPKVGPLIDIELEDTHPLLLLAQKGIDGTEDC